MIESYELEGFLEEFEKRMNNKFQRLQDQLDIISKKVKDENIKEFDNLIEYHYGSKIILQNYIIDSLNEFSIDIIKVDIKNQIIFLSGPISESDFLAKNILQSRFVNYTESD